MNFQKKKEHIENIPQLLFFYELKIEIEKH